MKRHAQVLLAIIVDVTGQPLHKIRDPQGNKDLQFCRWAFMAIMKDNFHPTHAVIEFAAFIERDIQSAVKIDNRIKELLDVLKYREWYQKIESKYRHTTT